MTTSVVCSTCLIMKPIETMRQMPDRTWRCNDRAACEQVQPQLPFPEGSA